MACQGRIHDCLFKILRILPVSAAIGDHGKLIADRRRSAIKIILIPVFLCRFLRQDNVPAPFTTLSEQLTTFSRENTMVSLRIKESSTTPVIPYSQIMANAVIESRIIRRGKDKTMSDDKKEQRKMKTGLISPYLPVLSKIWSLAVTVLFCLISVGTLCGISYAGINGVTFGLQELLTVYGTEAVGYYLYPGIGMLTSVGLFNLATYFGFLLQLIFLIREKTIRPRLFLILLITIVLGIVTALAVTPISNAYRTNRDIPQEVTEHFTSLYGASGLRIIKTKGDWGKSYNSTYGSTYTYIKTTYKVQSPSISGALEVKTESDHFGKDKPELPCNPITILEYNGQEFLLDEATGSYLPINKEEAITDE